MNRKRVAVLLIAVYFVLGGFAHAQQAREDVSQQSSCMQCGMDRGKYDYSRMWTDYDDGTSAATCSLRCAAVDLAENMNKTPKSIKVGDFNSRRLINAEKAFWVTGGGKRGVMTRQGKWAFENKKDAEEFMKTNQGRMVYFEEALEMAFDELTIDTTAIREKRKMTRAQTTGGKK